MERTQKGYQHGFWQGSLDHCLSPRELQSVLLVANGHTYKEGAKALGVAPTTFSDRINNVFFKLGVARCPQAVSEAIRTGIISPLSALMLCVLINAVTANDIDIRSSTRPLARRPREEQVS